MWKFARSGAGITLATASVLACSADAPAERVAPAPDAEVPDAFVPVAVDAGDASDAPLPLDMTAILAQLATCKEVTTGRYKTDSDSATATVPICELPNALFWQADMDIDCDGKPSAECNKTADPSYSDQTSGQDSMGQALDAAVLPYVVVPLKSARFDYSKHGLTLGSVIMVVYQGQYEFGVFGDQGPTTIIGEASYAMAKRLGIDPDPSTGGVESGVSYIAFTGPSAVVPKLEDHDEAVRLGELHARQWLTAK
jgi:hypothetical protein